MPSKLAAQMSATGFPIDLAGPLGIIILVCAFAYAVPATSVLGAILITGFAGGAICMHFRVGEAGSPPQIVALLIGLFAWAGLVLRQASLRALLPLVKADRPL